MKDYIITVFLFPDIEVEDTDDFAENLLKETNSFGGSYVMLGTSMIMTLRGVIDKPSLFEIVGELSCEIGDSFIITEVKDDYSVMIPGESSDNIFSIEYGSGNISRVEFDSEESYEDFVKNLLLYNHTDTEKDCFKACHTPSLNLDLILDKINSTGIESLNNKELEYLKNYN